MNVQPVIQRELRVASRQKATWRLRMAFGGGALAAFAFGMVWPDTSPAERGQVVLICLSVAGFALSLFAGPYLTADAISEERREGTLGLLFLTPLNGWQILSGKMATHALQVGYAWLAVFPVFFLPLLLGGVSAGEVSRLLGVLLVTLLLSVTCGLFWSTLCTEARTSVMATLGSLLLLVFLPWLGVWLRELTRGAWSESGPFQLSPMAALIFSFESVFNRGARPTIGWLQTGAETFWVSTLCQVAIATGLLVAASVLLPRVWRRAETGGTAATVSARHRSESRIRGGRPGWLPAITDAPLVWLFCRGPSRAAGMRILTLLLWMFFAAMLLSSLTRVAEEGFIAAFCAAYARHLILRVQFAFDATRRLQEDRRSGALELLLTTPVSDEQLAAAHREAMRRRGRGALTGALVMNGLLELWVFLCFDHLNMDYGAWFIFSVWFVGGGIMAWSDLRTMSWLALRQAGRNLSQLKAVGVILATLQLPAWIAFGLTFALATESGDEGWIGLMFSAWVLACLAYNLWWARRCQAWMRRGLRWHVAEGR